MTGEQLITDLQEALSLLQMAGPNPLIVTEDEYWTRCTKLLDKYFPDQDEEEDADEA